MQTTTGPGLGTKIRMQISFSEYTIVEKTTQALDPLGLMRPANALRDAIFPQFTVLTRHPAHLGLLCAVWQELDAAADAKATPRARRFRELEVLWGVACAVRGERPVNITKFSRLVERGLPLSLPAISRQDAVFRRLGYGTLGHYNRPAVSWGLLRRGSEGLTPLGGQLGNGFAARASGGASGDTTESRSLAVAPVSSPRRNLITCVNGTSTASAVVGGFALSIWVPAPPPIPALQTTPTAGCDSHIPWR